ncbi:MAG: hypothetical protein AB7V77_04305 [Candidatus Woesearchaeota archaeon]
MNKEIWYEKLGFKENPFSIKPAFFDDEIIGYDKEVDTLSKKLKKKNMFFLEAEYGKGKSTIIAYLINEFKGKNKIIYISRNRSDRALNYAKLLKKANTGFGKLFNLKAKNVVLFIDEVGKINKKDCMQIEELYSKNYIQSVLFADVSLKEANLTNSIKKEIGKNTLKLKNITSKDAVELVKSRLETLDLISEDLIKKVFTKSKENTRTFLNNMEKVFRYSFEKGNEKIKNSDIEVI